MSFSIGLSASDREPGYPRVAPEVLGAVDHLEFGGSRRIGEDDGVREFLVQASSPVLGRHLVSLSLPARFDVTAHAREIRSELSGLPVAYAVIDVGFWTLGTEPGAPIWFRPCRLTREAARLAAENARAITQAASLPLFVENPFIGAPPDPSGMTLVDFISELAEGGAALCLDIGHFHAWYVQHGRETSLQALARLPFEAIGLVHLAGLSRVDFAGRAFELDNHEVPPTLPCLELLHAILKRARPRYVTFEAEFASAQVQLTGLSLLHDARGMSQ